MKALFKIPYYAFIVCVAALGLLLLATLVPLGGGVKVKIVKSGSMEPAIRTGGIVVIRPDSPYKMGDVVTFGADTKTQIPTTHRIVEVKENGEFVTRGDANDAPDPSAVKPFEVSGKVIFTAPYVGYILDFAKKPVGFFLLIGVPALLVILDELSKIWTEVKRLRQNKRERSGEKPRESRTLPVDGIRRRVVEVRPSPAMPFGRASASSLRAMVIVAVSLVPILGLSSAGNTVSYFRDSETSFGSTLQASADYGGLFRTSKSEISSLTLDIPLTEETISEGGGETTEESKDEPAVQPLVENEAETPTESAGEESEEPEDKPKEDTPPAETTEETSNSAEASLDKPAEEVVEDAPEPAPEPPAPSSSDSSGPAAAPADPAPVADLSQSSGE